MPEQDLARHARYVPGYHFVLAPLLLVALVAAIVEVVRAFGRGEGRLSAVVLLLLAIAAGHLTWFVRSFPLRAQDRAIRAEEALRHFVLTGRPLDSRLTVRQIVGLRFAADEELPALAARAAEEGLSERAIKRTVQRWRPDTYRV